MILRALLALVFAAASVGAAWADCVAGRSAPNAGVETAARSAHAAHRHHTSEPAAKGDAKAARVCDAMVQAMAPHAPAVAPAMVLTPAVMIAVTIAALPSTAVTAPRAERPPDTRRQRFKDIYAKSGRFLV